MFGLSKRVVVATLTLFVVVPMKSQTSISPTQCDVRIVLLEAETGKKLDDRYLEIKLTTVKGRPVEGLRFDGESGELSGSIMQGKYLLEVIKLGFLPVKVGLPLLSSKYRSHISLTLGSVVAFDSPSSLTVSINGIDRNRGLLYARLVPVDGQPTFDFNYHTVWFVQDFDRGEVTFTGFRRSQEYILLVLDYSSEGTTILHSSVVRTPIVGSDSIEVQLQR